MLNIFNIVHLSCIHEGMNDDLKYTEDIIAFQSQKTLHTD